MVGSDCGVDKIDIVVQQNANINMVQVNAITDGSDEIQKFIFKKIFSCPFRFVIDCNNNEPKGKDTIYSLFHEDHREIEL